MNPCAGLAPTQVLFRPPASAPAGSATQQSQADRLDAFFDVGTQTLREVRQTGNFQYRDGDRQASADDAHYDAQTQTMLLLGHPQVWDPNSRVKCQKMTIDMRTNTSTGEGKVQATHLPKPAPGAPRPRLPALPTNVLADKMVARRREPNHSLRRACPRLAGNGRGGIDGAGCVPHAEAGQFRLAGGDQLPATRRDGQRDRRPPPIHPGETRPVTVHADFLEYFDRGPTRSLPWQCPPGDRKHHAAIRSFGRLFQPRATRWRARKWITRKRTAT